MKIPLSVPNGAQKKYKANFLKASHGGKNLFLLAADQKIEHLNDDFSEKFKNSDPEHLFKIAEKSKIGVLALHLGLLSRYGGKYKKIPYLVKLNAKSNLVKSRDPLSTLLWTVKDVIDFNKKNRLNILGVGYTLYLGSEYEDIMLREAAQVIKEAHAHGLLAVLWIYPRGKNVSNEKSLDLLAGAAGVALCLGADFVKLNYPFKENKTGAQKFKKVVEAAGNTRVICSGGAKISSEKFLEMTKNQIKIAGCRGVAVGRNVHQNDLKTAVKAANQIAKIVY